LPLSNTGRITELGGQIDGARTWTSTPLRCASTSTLAMGADVKEHARTSNVAVSAFQPNGAHNASNNNTKRLLMSSCGSLAVRIRRLPRVYEGNKNLVRRLANIYFVVSIGNLIQDVQLLVHFFGMIPYFPGQELCKFLYL
jgi:hypothetical protein